VARHAHVARQPIYDRRIDVVGYELLLRDAGDDTAFVSDPDASTSSVIFEVLSTLGLERLVGTRLAHINVTRRFVLDANRSALPAERIVLELAGDLCVDKQLLTRLRVLKRQRFTLALDDFAYDPTRRPLLEIADLVKINVVGAEPGRTEAVMDLLAPFPPRLIAARIGSYEALDDARRLGFHLFQGYFFCMPKAVKGSEIPTAHVERDALFTTGLFSVVDAMMDAAMDELIPWLPFSSNVTEGLIRRTGPYGRVLDAMLAHERGELVTTGSTAPAAVGRAYLEAPEWADETGAELR
jgi:c-di-GMP-related signal transduction protein